MCCVAQRVAACQVVAVAAALAAAGGALRVLACASIGLEAYDCRHAQELCDYFPDLPPRRRPRDC